MYLGPRVRRVHAASAKPRAAGGTLLRESCSHNTIPLWNASPPTCAHIYVVFSQRSERYTSWVGIGTGTAHRALISNGSSLTATILRVSACSAALRVASTRQFPEITTVQDILIRSLQDEFRDYGLYGSLRRTILGIPECFLSLIRRRFLTRYLNPRTVPPPSH